MSPELIDYAIYAAAAIGLAAAIWPRRKGVPANTESQPGELMVEKLEKIREQEENRGQQRETELGKMLKRMLLSTHRAVEKKMRQSCGLVLDEPIWIIEQRGNMDWAEYASQQANPKSQIPNPKS